MIHCSNPLLSTAIGSCQLSTVNCQLMKPPRYENLLSTHTLTTPPQSCNNF
ncbi:MAG: hypothetical protein JGK08_00305 [Microcoleus sp. PH2017_04_SCI_O_A]|nr:hypothetical protein [Microcoleus sp. PH2017_04_SCI_O_A]